MKTLLILNEDSFELKGVILDNDYSHLDGLNLSQGISEFSESALNLLVDEDGEYRLQLESLSVILNEKRDFDSCAIIYW